MPGNSCGYTPYFWCLPYTSGFPLMWLEWDFLWQYPLWYTAVSPGSLPSFAAMSHSFTENIIEIKSLNSSQCLPVHGRNNMTTKKNDSIEINWTTRMSKNLAFWFVSDVQRMVSTFQHSRNLIKMSACWRGKAEYKRFLCQTGESLEQLYRFRLKKHTDTCATLQLIWYVQGTIITNTGMSDMYLPK